MSMTFDKARQIQYDVWGEKVDDGLEANALFREALTWLTHHSNDQMFLVQLGDFYRNKYPQLTEKYYKLSTKNNYAMGYEALASLYYDEKYVHYDPKQAFINYQKAAKLGNNYARYMVAKMYREGKGVKQNKEKSIELIRGLWAEVSETGTLDQPVVGAGYELARYIFLNEKTRLDYALEVLKYSRNYFIEQTEFYGTSDMYLDGIIEIDKLIDRIHPRDKYDYDIFYMLCVLKNQSTIRLIDLQKSKEITITSKHEGNSNIINFQNKNYHGVEDFFINATGSNGKEFFRQRDNYEVISIERRD